MRTSARFFGLFAPSLLCIPLISAQSNTPPPDPHEMVRREPHTLSKPAERSAAFRLLSIATAERAAGVFCHALHLAYYGAWV
jgi:hypothetical protein